MRVVLDVFLVIQNMDFFVQISKMSIVSRGVGTGGRGGGALAPPIISEGIWPPVPLSNLFRVRAKLLPKIYFQKLLENEGNADRCAQAFGVLSDHTCDNSYSRT